MSTKISVLRPWALRTRGAGFLSLGLFLSLVTAPMALADEPPRVVATIKPIHSLAAMVLGDVVKPQLLIDGAQSPHSYALKPSEAKALNNADIVIQVSDVMESFMSRVRRSLPDSVTVIDLADVEGIRQLEVRTGATFEAHDHGDHAHGHAHHDHGEHKDAKADHKDAHDGHDHSHGHDHGQKVDHAKLDGHIWLDPRNAKVIVRYLSDVFVGRWPEHAFTFVENADRAIAQIDAIDAELSDELASLRDERFIVFHDAYQYFENRFGLSAAGAISLKPDVPPGAKRLSQLRATVKKLGVSCVFAEPQFKDRVVKTVSEGSGARTGILDPLGVSIEPGPGQYPKLMQNLAAGFKACLGAQG